MTLEWKQPPVNAKGARRALEIDAVVDELRQHPGEWAIVARNVNSANTRTWTKRGCEVTTHREEVNALNITIYARWPEQS
jgi:hypothetical protein